MKTNKGFTLIETIIYIGLFAILIGGLFLGAFQLTTNTYSLEEDVVLEEEVNFVMKKIDWVLTNMETITNPLSGFDDELQIVNKDNKDVIIDIDNDNDIEICIEDADPFCNKLTSVNVKVDPTSFKFTYIEPQGDSPAGINAQFKIDDRTVSINKYIR